MRKKSGLVLIICIIWVFPFRAETDSRILLTVGGKPVSVAEFSHYYLQVAAAKKISAEDFLPHFLYFKLKVFDARKHKWDTLPDFRLQCSLLQGKALEYYHVQNGYSSSGVRKEVSRTISDEWVKLEHISLYLSQHASGEEERKACRTIDSIYSALRGGASFHELSLKYNLPGKKYLTDEWMPVAGMLDEFVEQFSHLRSGEFSKPFYSPLGLHIVRLVDRKRGDIPDGKPCFGRMATDEEQYSDEISRMFARIEDELLAVYWDVRNAVTDADISDKELEEYFKSHKRYFTWNLPHFKGGVVHCLNKRAASKLRKELKRIPFSQWQEKIKELAGKDKSLAAEVENGLFRIGTNEFVDKLAFKCGGYTPRPDFPYTFVLGKCLKKAPDDYRDVLGKLRKNYISFCENLKLQELKDKFSVEINQDVLKTVNCDGIK